MTGLIPCPHGAVPVLTTQCCVGFKPRAAGWYLQVLEAITFQCVSLPDIYREAPNAVETELETYLRCFREHGTLWLGGYLRKRDAVWRAGCAGTLGRVVCCCFSILCHSGWPRSGCCARSSGHSRIGCLHGQTPCRAGQTIAALGAQSTGGR